VQLEAVELEVDLAQLDAALRARLQIAHAPNVPGDHRARAVVALGNDLFEVQVLERVILGHHRELLVEHGEARAARYGKALECAAHLQTKVVVRTAGIVQMHHEAPAARLARGHLVLGAERLVRGQRIALIAVQLERVRGTAHFARRLGPCTLGFCCGLFQAVTEPEA